MDRFVVMVLNVQWSLIVTHGEIGAICVTLSATPNIRGCPRATSTQAERMVHTPFGDPTHLFVFLLYNVFLCCGEEWRRK